MSRGIMHRRKRTLARSVDPVQASAWICNLFRFSIKLCVAVVVEAEYEFGARKRSTNVYKGGHGHFPVLILCTQMFTGARFRSLL